MVRIQDFFDVAEIHIVFGFLVSADLISLRILPPIYQQYG